jgi:hypothetical protein
MTIFAYDTYEGIHQNVPGVVFGTGMSMSLVLGGRELTMQDLHPAVVVGIKQSYRMIDSTYWVCMDDVYYDIDRSRILNISATKFTLASPSPTEDARKDNQIVLLKKSAEGEQAKTDSERFSELCSKSDSGVAALRIAHLMGLNPIYVVGLADKVHNGQFYFHTDSVATDVDPNAIFSRKSPRMKTFVEEIRASGTDVISCSPISSLNEFVPFVPLVEVLRKLRETK